MFTKINATYLQTHTVTHTSIVQIIVQTLGCLVHCLIGRADSMNKARHILETINILVHKKYDETHGLLRNTFMSDSQSAAIYL